MKAKVLFIAWHPLEAENGKNAPILAVDFVPASSRLPFRIAATAGQDGVVRIWRLEDKEIEIKNSNNGKINPVDGNDEQKGSGTTTETRTSTKLVATHRADLTGFTCSVNALRFSPNAECLATAGDDGSVFVWGCRRDRGYYRWDCVTDARHLSKRLMRGRCSEIYDIAWSPDSKRLMAGSVDGSIKIWDVSNGDLVHSMKDHQGFVQGVSWDPLNQYVASQGASSKSTVRVYSIEKVKKKGPFHIAQTISRRKRVLGPSEQETADRLAEQAAKKLEIAAAKLQAEKEAEALRQQQLLNITVEDGAVPETSTTTTVLIPKVKKPRKKSQTYEMYMDDITTNTFFRRLEWTVDGSFLLTPAAIFKNPETKKSIPTVYAFGRKQWANPLFHLPGVDDSVPVAVRCSPIIYQLKTNKDGKTHPQPYIDLPYRMVYAVATMNSVVLYDTQHAHPIALIGNLHYANLTDLSWSHDGNTILMSSTDGYCSVAIFDEGELGQLLPKEDLPAACKITHQPHFFANEKKFVQEEEEEEVQVKTTVEDPTITATTDNNNNNNSKDNETTEKPKKRRIQLISMVSSVPEGANATPAINQLAPRKKKDKTGKKRVALINLSSTTGGAGAGLLNEPSKKTEGGINILQVKSKKKIKPQLISP